ncbi:MAG: hypothetical protein GF308_12520 [Candidatus Heimdallarchaeota archaeon]|nr:hypothetical protein [Candidatus Heimdallarchaeota archaeon]
MSPDYLDDDFEEIEEWAFIEEEEEEEAKKRAVPLKDRMSIWDIVKLVGLFVAFAIFFLYFRFWDFFAKLMRFGGSEEMGNSRLLYLTLLLFPLAAAVFIKYLADVSSKLLISPKESSEA